MNTIGSLAIAACGAVVFFSVLYTVKKGWGRGGWIRWAARGLIGLSRWLWIVGEAILCGLDYYERSHVAEGRNTCQTK